MQPEEIIGAIIFFLSVGILLGSWLEGKYIRWQTRRRERKKANIISFAIVLSGIGLILLAVVFIIKFITKKISGRNQKQIKNETTLIIEADTINAQQDNSDA